MAYYEVKFRPQAWRQFRKLPRQVQEKLKAPIDALAGEPRPAGCRALAGQEGLWRIRVGDYRIIYQIEDERLVVLVVRLGHRREVYRAR